MPPRPRRPGLLAAVRRLGLRGRPAAHPEGPGPLPRARTWRASSRRTPTAGNPPRPGWARKTPGKAAKKTAVGSARRVPRSAPGPARCSARPAARRARARRSAPAPGWWPARPSAPARRRPPGRRPAALRRLYAQCIIATATACRRRTRAGLGLSRGQVYALSEAPYAYTLPLKRLSLYVLREAERLAGLHIAAGAGGGGGGGGAPPPPPGHGGLRLWAALGRRRGYSSLRSSSFTFRAQKAVSSRTAAAKAARVGRGAGSSPSCASRAR